LGAGFGDDGPGGIMMRLYTAEKPRIGSRIVRCMGCDTSEPAVTVVDVTDVPVTEIRRRDSVVRYYGVKLSTGPWVSAADCVLACSGQERSDSEAYGKSAVRS
jgi:hypothetical protein